MALTDKFLGRRSFDEVVSGEVADDSGNSRTGTVNGASYTASGKVNGCLSFNGTTDSVSLPSNSTNRLPTGAFSVGCWCKSDQLANNACLMELDWASSSVNARDAGIKLEMRDSASSNVFFGNLTTANKTDFYALDSTTGADTSNRFFVVFTRESNGTLRIWVNNSNEATDATGDTSAVDYDGDDYDNNTVDVGRRNRAGSSGTFWDGKIDECFICDEALTSDDIATLRNSGDGYNPFTGATVINNVLFKGQNF